MDIVVSTLIMACDPARVAPFAENLLYALYKLREATRLESELVVRLNVSARQAGKARMDGVREALNHHAARTDIPLTVHADGRNIGFGPGHNANLAGRAARAYFIVNDDIILKDASFLAEAIERLETRSKPPIGAIGASGGPGAIADGFAFTHRRPPLAQLADYADGAALVVSPQAFEAVGGFDEAYGYAYFEDADLSLRLKANGYALHLVDIPHEHHRASTSMGLGPAVYARLYEHNRALFLARWKDRLSERAAEPRRRVDLTADGIGDLVDFYYPLKALAEDCVRQGIALEVYCPKASCRFLFESLPVTLVDRPRELGARHLSYVDLGAVNFSAPQRTIDLVAGHLGVVSLQTDPAAVRAFVRQRADETFMAASVAAPYAIVHVDSQRTTFHGRAVDRSAWLPLLERLVSRYRLVIVGQHDTKPVAAYETFLKAHADRVTDLRDAGTVETMFHAIEGAALFVGIDSGPMHIAQLFGIPSFVAFGSVHPASKVYREESTGVHLETGLDCIGCYHRYVERAYNFCMRTDEACVAGITGAALLSSFEAFERGGARLSEPPLRESWLAIQRESLRLQVHNPFFKSRLLGQPRGQKATADAVIVAVDAVMARAEDRAIQTERELGPALTQLMAERDDALRKAEDARHELAQSQLRANNLRSRLSRAEREQGELALKARLETGDRATLELNNGAVYPDGWTSQQIACEIKAEAPVTALHVDGWCPGPNTLIYAPQDPDAETATAPIALAFELTFALVAQPGETVRFTLGVARPHLVEGDRRSLGFVLRRLRVEGSPAADDAHNAEGAGDAAEAEAADLSA